MSAPSLTNHTDYAKHRGVRHTNSGKWGAVIRHPSTKVSMWLGSYDTPKEAADAYMKKKLEFDSMVTYATVDKVDESLNKKSCETKFMDQAKINCKESNVHVTETAKAHSVETTSLGNTDAVNCVKMPASSRTSHTDYAKHRGVRHTKSGKWGATIRHPITNVSVWLGSYDTPKEAAGAYMKKKLEFHSMVTYATVEKVEESLNKKSCETKFMDQAKMNCKESNVHVTEAEKAHSVETTSLGNTDAVNCVNMSAPSVTSHTDYTKHRGVRHTKSGKWGAAIRHPITNVSVWLGSYNTPKEAADAYVKKKLEFDSMVMYATVEKKVEESLNKKSCETKFMDQAKMNCKESKVHVTETAKAHSVDTTSLGNTDAVNCVKRLPGSGSVYRTKVDKCQAQISITKVRVCEGICTTPEEAKAALYKNKQDLHSISHAESFANESVALSESVNEQVTCSRPRVVYQRKTGRRFAETQNPMAKVKLSVGTYDNAEESLEAPNRKRCEYAEMVHYEKEEHEKSNVEAGLVSKCEDIVSEAREGSQVNVDSIQVPCSSFVSNDDFDTGVINANEKSVGEFKVGSYATPEEAEAALHNKRQDLDSMPHVESFSRESVSLSEHVNGQVTCCRPRVVYQRKTGRRFAEIQNPMTKVKRSMGTYDTTEEALEALNREMCEYTEMVHSEKKQKKSNVEAAFVSKFQEVVSEASVGSQVNVDSIQVPCSSFVASEEFEMGGINAHGELVGEFSRLDDELFP